MGLAGVASTMLCALQLLAWCPTRGRSLTRHIVYENSDLSLFEAERLEEHCIKMGLEDMVDCIWQKRAQMYLKVESLLLVFGGFWEVLAEHLSMKSSVV